MARINREEIIGNHYQSKDWGKYVILSYEGKDDKNKHWYKIAFENGNVELVSWDNIRKGNVVDSRTRKLNKAKVEQIRLKQRNKLTKQSKHTFKPRDLHLKSILSIDLATYSTGISYAKNGQIVKSGVITSKDDNIDIRCYEIVKKLREILIKGKIDYVILESTFLGCNSTILEKLSSVRGALVYQLTDLNIEYGLVPPNLWKNHYAMPTTRNEQKAWVMENYERLTGEKPISDDQCDSYFMLKFALSIPE